MTTRSQLQFAKQLSQDGDRMTIRKSETAVSLLLI